MTRERFLTKNHRTGRKKQNPVLGLYGAVPVVRAYCGECQGSAMVFDGLFACCDRAFAGDVEKSKRMSDAGLKRHPISASEKNAKLDEQENCCLYCTRAFGAMVWRNGKGTRLRIEWDHLVPFSYAHDNGSGNFAACCQICNGIKSSWIFQTIESARVYVMNELERKGYV